jgi:hypothetical protein
MFLRQQNGKYPFNLAERTKLFLAPALDTYPACTEGATQGERPATPGARPPIHAPAHRRLRTDPRRFQESGRQAVTRPPARPAAAPAHQREPERSGYQPTSENQNEADTSPPARTRTDRYRPNGEHQIKRYKANGEHREPRVGRAGGSGGSPPRTSTPRISGKLAPRASEQHELSRGRGGI